MPYFVLPTFARKATLPFSVLGRLISNAWYLSGFLGLEHNSDGTHNAAEVAKGVFTAKWASSAYTLEGNTGLAASVTRNGTGDITILLNDGVFMPLLVEVDSMSENWPNKPQFVAVEVGVDSGQFYIRIRHYQLSTALGSIGNAIALSDASMAVRVLSWPTAVGQGSGIGRPDEYAKGFTLGADATRWNQFVALVSNLRKSLLVEHDSSGAHNTRLIPREIDKMNWSGSAWTHTGGTMAPTSSSTGIINCGFSVTRTGPFQTFVQADWNYLRSGALISDIFLAGSPISTDTGSKVVYGYQYDSAGNVWVRANVDFGIAVHCA